MLVRTGIRVHDWLPVEQLSFDLDARYASPGARALMMRSWYTAIRLRARSTGVSMACFEGPDLSKRGVKPIDSYVRNVDFEAGDRHYRIACIKDPMRAASYTGDSKRPQWVQLIKGGGGVTLL